MKTKNKAEAAPASCGQHPWQCLDSLLNLQRELYRNGATKPGAILLARDQFDALLDMHAAMPQMLAALQSCFAMLTSPKFSGWIDANCADDELWAMTQAMIQRRDEARAAIAKAERGEA